MSRPIRKPSTMVLAVAAALGAFASSAAARNVYVVNESSVPGSVSVIDSATNQMVGAAIPVGSTPFAVAITPNGSRAYVANGGPGTVSVIDTTSNQVVGSPIPVGLEPRAIAITPDGSRAYVANRDSGTVSVIDIATNTVVSTIPIGGGTEPFAIAITPDGSRAYVANLGPDTVSVIDTQTNTLTGPAIVVGTNPEGIAITPDSSRAYVANNGATTNVSVIDTQTNTVIASPGVGNNPFGVAVTPNGLRAYVTNSGAANSVSVIDTQTNTVVGAPIAFGFGTQPSGIAVTPDGTHSYVALRAINSVSVVDTATNAVAGGPIGVGVQPITLAIVPDQPPKAALSAPAKGLKATLKGGGSSDPDGQVATYSWDFGDGKGAQTSAPTAKHNYKKVGLFTARLTVTDGEGCSTARIFTGQTVSCNGSSFASITRTVGTIKLGKLKRNEENGTATLTVKVPSKGTLKLSGKGVVKRRPDARASSLAKAVQGKGKVKLRIKAKGKKSRKLDRSGTVKLKVKVTFKPKGGDRNTQTKRVKLAKRH